LTREDTAGNEIRYGEYTAGNRNPFPQNQTLNNGGNKIRRWKYSRELLGIFGPRFEREFLLFWLAPEKFGGPIWIFGKLRKIAQHWNLEPSWIVSHPMNYGATREIARVKGETPFLVFELILAPNGMDFSSKFRGPMVGTNRMEFHNSELIF
jgi:hypothetical protein